MSKEQQELLKIFNLEERQRISYKNSLLKMLDQHLTNVDVEFTEKQAYLASILQTLFEINPNSEEMSTQDHLRLRRICVYCQDLMNQR